MTEEIKYQEEVNFPPTLMEDPNALGEAGVGVNRFYTLGQPIIYVQGNEPAFQLSFQVYDANVEQQLQYAYFVGPYRGDGLGVPGGEIPANPDLDPIRTFRFPVLSGFENLGCHRVTVLVSSAFFSSTITPRQDPSDLSEAVVWIYTVQNEQGLIDPNTCIVGE